MGTFLVEIQGVFAYSAESLIRAGRLTKARPLALIRDQNNKHDKNAVEVRTADGERHLLGYIPRGLAPSIANAIAHSIEISASIHLAGWVARKGKSCPSIIASIEGPDSFLKAIELFIPHFVQMPSIQEPIVRRRSSSKLPDEISETISRLNGKSGVYAIKNESNNKQYIGSSKDIGKRLKQHLDDLQAGTHPNSLLQHDWSTYGCESFTCRAIKLLDGASSAELEREEARQVSRLHSHYSGYNQTRDGSYSGGKASYDERIRFASRSAASAKKENVEAQPKAANPQPPPTTASDIKSSSGCITTLLLALTACWIAKNSFLQILM
jgi:hypothetical protein